MREAPNPLSDPTGTLVPSHQTPQPTPSSAYNQTSSPYGPQITDLLLLPLGILPKIKTLSPLFRTPQPTTL
jgi:hypothetical protein